ncbi:MAG: 2-dehydro-3-deoxygluconokinase [Candidatus Celerinatantimonas neptuna]|nr:MAG: 2-dehydro-3-deoxygluconokinase [Candidatus Celerinatantimonas neptuna]
MSNMQIAILGECMVELQQQQPGLLSRKFGGDTLNTAIYMARLTQKADVQISYFTGLGHDTFSQEMLLTWKNEGIDTRYVQQIEGKLPGLYLIETDETGERQFRYWRNDSAAKYFLEQKNSDQLIHSLSQFNWIYLSGISLAILTPTSRKNLLVTLQEAKNNGSHIVFDNNYRPALWDNKEQAQKAYSQVLKLTDLALLTFDDEIALYQEHSIGECVERTHNFGVQDIIIKMGADPCHLFVEDKHYTVAANKLDKSKIIDTTAAGDSFGAGFMAAMLLGKSYQVAARWGHQLAGTVIQYKGAIIEVDAMPTLTDD